MPQFYEWESQYHKFKTVWKRDGERITDNLDKWYYDILQQYRSNASFISSWDPRPGNSITGLMTERQWFRTGQPYYKVFPQMATMMSEVSIDIPVGELRLPYEGFTVQLAIGPENDFVEDGFQLKALLVSEVHVERNLDGKSFKQPILTAGLATGATRALRIGYEFTGPDNQFDYTMSLHGEDRLLEEEFQQSWDFSWPEAKKQLGDEWAPSKALVSRVLRLAIATCFFGIDCHEVVMPDLQRRVVEQHAWKTKAKYDAAYRDLSSKLRKEAKHWTIGNEIALPKPIVQRADTEGGGGTAPSHAYMKRGHMRWQRVGKGRKERDLVFVHPHICRPDLPMGKSHGYRIPDEA
jgi:hypothetical protein